MTETMDIQINEISESGLSKIDFNNLSFGKTFSDHMFIADYKNGEWSDLRITPYQNLSLQQVFNCIKIGHILERPVDTPGTIYSLMVQCWEKKPVMTAVTVLASMKQENTTFKEQLEHAI